MRAAHVDDANTKEAEDVTVGLDVVASVAMKPAGAEAFAVNASNEESATTANANVITNDAAILSERVIY